MGRLNLVRRAQARARPLSLEGPSLVLAPHPDDETLGCGGTIVKARTAGESVVVAFLTDGAESHRRFVQPAELVALRRSEALAAASVLGVESPGLHFLGHADGRLGDREPEAVEQLVALATGLRLARLFTPCPWEGIADHVAAARIGRAVGRATGAEVYGYPIWFWDRWPWTPTRSSGRARTLARAAVGRWRLVREFRHSVYVSDVLERKRAALARHRTQVERPEGNPAWPVLAEAGGGGLLPLVFQDYELFARLGP